MKLFDRFFTGRSRPPYDLIKLSGEFDMSQVAGLRSTLNRASGRPRFALVDLSRVTFIDSACLTELVVYHQLHAGRLLLCRPSPQVELGAEASGLGGWLTFHPDEKSARRAMIGDVAGTLHPRRITGLPGEAGEYRGV